MRPLTDAQQRVVRHENVVTAIHAQSRAFGVVDEVVDDTDVVCFVLNPRGRHELIAGSLACGEASCATVVELVVLDDPIGGSTFHIGAPVVGAMDAVANHVSVLHAHGIDGIVPRP